uniref:Uncharacterized protein n=1 Tax=Arundo donax TaxID=35708 RepID=A0A0A9C4A4_ARUDO
MHLYVPPSTTHVRFVFIVIFSVIQETRNFVIL